MENVGDKGVLCSVYDKRTQSTKEPIKNHIRLQVKDSYGGGSLLDILLCDAHERHEADARLGYNIIGILKQHIMTSRYIIIILYATQHCLTPCSLMVMVDGATAMST